MADPVQTLQELREYILRKLGGCNVKVELSPQQVDDAIYDALDQFNQYMCKAEPRVLAEQSGQVTIELLEGDRGVIAVKLLYPEQYREYAQMNIFEIMYRMVFPRLPLGEWYELKMFYEMYQKVRGTDPDWYEDEATKNVYVDCWSGPYDIFYIVARDLRVEEISHLKAAYSRMFKKLALAEAKITLSYIRGKYGASIPVPGGTLTTDAAELKGDGLQERVEVIEKLEQIGRYQISPVMWG